MYQGSHGPCARSNHIDCINPDLADATLDDLANADYLEDYLSGFAMLHDPALVDAAIEDLEERGACDPWYMGLRDGIQVAFGVPSEAHVLRWRRR